MQEPGPSGAGAQGDRGDAPRPASAPPRSSPAPVYAGMRRAALVDPAAGFDAATGGRDLRQAGWQEMGGAVLVKPPPARALASAIEASSSSGTARDVAYALSNDNVGFRLLKQAGWSEGQGLGLRGAGIAVPLAPLANAGRRGLGVRGAVRAVEPGAAGGDKGYWQLREEQKRLIVAQLGPGACMAACHVGLCEAGRLQHRRGNFEWVCRCSLSSGVVISNRRCSGACERRRSGECGARSLATGAGVCGVGAGSSRHA